MFNKLIKKQEKYVELSDLDKNLLRDMLIYSRKELVKDYGYKIVDDFGKRFLKFFNIKD